ncbi:hypothetical protein ALC57_00123 [Trachymyrmex cornetzi]|uniref:DUF8040 domain-containing protein n=1 Tax=Trachymyrmex cornetzi TaxID=471704 RepID=A0A151K2Z2_9HYME|nr:hypothetical protein ALC57_00123 [Trachymyrmex cornetzi]
MYLYMKNKKHHVKRRWWLRFVNRVTRQQGFFNNLFREVYETDHEEFFSMTRMLPEQFDQLCDRVRLYLTKRSNRTPISVEERLAVTLQFLAHGDSVKSKSWEYCIGRSTAHKIIGETCDAIWKALQKEYLPRPKKERWTEIMNEFYNK